MHADRTNRAALIVFALVLVAGGGAGIAASWGVFGHGVQHRSLIDNVVGHYVGRHGVWLWWAAAGLALVVVLLALRWLLVLLFSTDRTGDLTIARGGGDGRTSLAAGALVSAVVGETVDLAGVESAKARLIGDPDDPELVLEVRIRHDADLSELRGRVVEGPVAHARTAVGRADLPVRLDLMVTTASGPRVT